MFPEDTESSSSTTLPTSDRLDDIILASLSTGLDGHSDGLQSNISNDLPLLHDKDIIEEPQSSARKGRAKSHARKKPEGHISRPLNPFMLFRSKYAEKYGLTGSINCQDISRLAGAEWRDMSEDEKQPWRAKAEERKKQHALAHPNYRYTPSDSIVIRRSVVKGRDEESNRAAKRRCKAFARFLKEGYSSSSLERAYAEMERTDSALPKDSHEETHSHSQTDEGSLIRGEELRPPDDHQGSPTGSPKPGLHLSEFLKTANKNLEGQPEVQYVSDIDLPAKVRVNGVTTLLLPSKKTTNDDAKQWSLRETSAPIDVDSDSD